jgi:hypothetical protein
VVQLDAAKEEVSAHESSARMVFEVALTLAQQCIGFGVQTED